MIGWVGVENEINAISAFNLVGVEVEVEAELGKILWEKTLDVESYISSFLVN